MNTTEFNVTAYKTKNITDLEDGLKQLTKIAKKLQIEFSFELTEEGYVQVSGEYYAPFKTYTIYNNVVGLTGYTPVAKIDHLENDAIVINRICKSEDVVCHFTDSVCEHCGKNRNRVSTYIVKDANGKLIQVGKSCLREFLGISVEPFLKALAGLLEEEEEEEEDIEQLMQGGYYALKTVRMLQYILTAIGRWGYVSKANHCDDKPATSSRVWQIMREAEEAHKYNTGTDWLTPIEDAEEVMKYALDNLGVKKEIENNMHAILQAEYVRENHIGYLAYVPVWVSNHKNQAIVTAVTTDKPQSQYVGKVDGKIEATGTITFIKHFPSQYGTKTLVKVITNEGNILTWWASKFIAESETGNFVKITGTVKSQEVYNNEKQTTLTRCKMA